MIVAVSGVRDGRPWPPIGGVLDVPDEEAVEMLNNGIVTHVHDPESGVETREAPVPAKPPRKPAKRPARKRPAS